MAGSAVSWLGSTLVVCAAVTACSASPSDTASSSTGVPSDTSTSASSTTSDSPSSSSTSASASSPASASATSTNAAAGHACGNRDLSVALGRSRAAAGHVGVAVVFHNVTHVSCRLGGYPGVAGLDRQGHQVAQATRSNTGYLGGSYATRTLLLPPGGSASALVEGTDVPSGSEVSCTTFSALLVTAPGQTASHLLRTSFPGCPTFQVHPVVSGVDGGA